MWKLYKVQILVSVQFCWNPATRLHAAVAKPSSCDRDHVVCRADSIYCLALRRKDVLTPDLKNV